MRKFYVYCVAALSAASLFAQEDLVRAIDLSKVSLSPESYYRNSVMKAPEPGTVQAIAVGADGVYYASFNEAGYTTTSSIAVGALGSNLKFYNGRKAIDGATYQWTYTDGQNVFEMPVEDGMASMYLGGNIYKFPNVTTSNPAYTFNREDFVGKNISEEFQGCFVQHLQKSDLTLGMCDIPLGEQPMVGVAADQSQTDIRYMGDGMKLPDGTKMKSALQVFNRTTSDMLIYGGNLAFIVNQGKTLGLDKNLTIEVWELDLEGENLLKEKKGETTLSTNDLTEDNGFYFGTFEFIKSSGIIPVKEPVKIESGTDFGIVISGYEGTNLRNIVQFCGSYFSGNAYLIMEDNSLSTLPFVETNIPCTDMWLGLKVSMPAAICLFPTMEAPVEGGTVTAVLEGETYGETLLFTSDEIKSGLFELRTPGWLRATVSEVTVSNGQQTMGWELTSAYTVVLEADALAEGKGRQGWVEVYSPELDKVVARFEVGQGEWTPSGVESVKVANASVAVAGDNLMLTYGEDYNKATVYNVAGSVVASYALPQGGSFEVPAAELNGVYMVVFEGASREVVKVVK